MSKGTITECISVVTLIKKWCVCSCVNATSRCFWSLSHVSWARPNPNKSWSLWPSLTRGTWTVCIGLASSWASQTGSKTTRKSWTHHRAKTTTRTQHPWNRLRSEYIKNSTQIRLNESYLKLTNINTSAILVLKWMDLVHVLFYTYSVDYIFLWKKTLHLHCEEQHPRNIQRKNSFQCHWHVISG